MKHKAILFSLLLLIIIPSYSTGQEHQTDQKSQKKREDEVTVKKLKEKLVPLMRYSIEELQLALTLKVRQIYKGAKILSDEAKPLYLGTITDEFALDSIFNDFGTYGSQFSSESIWNMFGEYGGQFSAYSPFNRLSSSPPLIVKGGKVIGRLTVNKLMPSAVDPNWLKSHFKY